MSRTMTTNERRAKFDSPRQRAAWCRENGIPVPPGLREQIREEALANIPESARSQLRALFARVDDLTASVDKAKRKAGASNPSDPDSITPGHVRDLQARRSKEGVTLSYREALNELTRGVAPGGWRRGWRSGRR